jgi:hypothetical protein
MIKVDKEELIDCFKAIGDGKAIILKEELLTDYEFAAILGDYLENAGLNIHIKVKAPYIIIFDYFVAIPKIDEISEALGIPSDIITPVDYSIGYNYIINCKGLITQERCQEPVWSAKRFLVDLYNLGEDGTIDFDIESLMKIIKNRFEDFDEDILIAIDFEDRVMAIGIDKYIPDAKDEFSELIGIDKSLFIEVSGPFSTVMLIDGEKFYLLLEHYQEMDVEDWLI